MTHRKAVRVYICQHFVVMLKFAQFRNAKKVFPETANSYIL